MFGPRPLCMDCKHYNRYEEENLSCAAFPEGIPDDIIDGKFEHTKPYEGDKGIMFEKKEDE